VLVLVLVDVHVHVYVHVHEDEYVYEPRTAVSSSTLSGGPRRPVHPGATM
jgi:hypothetical protein